MLGQIIDTIVRFVSKLHCNIECCSTTVKVSSPCNPGAGDAGPKRRYKPRSPVRKQRTI